MSIIYDNYETVIGLEIHVELLTRSKLFCACSTAFGERPNSNTCPVCVGLPGSLPVLNQKAVEKIIMLGLALNSQISEYTWFDRKNYFYPDNPQNYQITQFYAPFCTGGYLKPDKGKTIRIKEMHLEDDAGKLLHQGNKTYIDYNRSGVPLIEIVTEPDFASAEEAVSFLKALREVLLALQISDCKMQEGSLRVDVNLSVREKNTKENGVRCEIKNVNSFSEIIRLASFEKKRQVDLLLSGQRVEQETRGWDEKARESFFMRKKETERDYRYYPEPDIPVLQIKADDIEAIKQTLPPLPEEVKQEMMKRYHINSDIADILYHEKKLCKLFEEAYILYPEPKALLNRLLTEGVHILNENGQGWENVKMKASDFVKLIRLTASGQISTQTEKEIMKRLFTESFDPEEYAERNHLKQTLDMEVLGRTARLVIEENPKSVNDYLAGKERAIQYLTGQGMKQLKGRADAQQLTACIKNEIDQIERRKT